jgi:hypothetical protein
MLTRPAGIEERIFLPLWVPMTNFLLHKGEYRFLIIRLKFSARYIYDYTVITVVFHKWYDSWYRSKRHVYCL